MFFVKYFDMSVNILTDFPATQRVNNSMNDSYPNFILRFCALHVSVNRTLVVLSVRHMLAVKQTWSNSSTDSMSKRLTYKMDACSGV